MRSPHPSPFHLTHTESLAIVNGASPSRGGPSLRRGPPHPHRNSGRKGIMEARSIRRIVARISDRIGSVTGAAGAGLPIGRRGAMVVCTGALVFIRTDIAELCGVRSRSTMTWDIEAEG